MGPPQLTLGIRVCCCFCVTSQGRGVDHNDAAAVQLPLKELFWNLLVFPSVVTLDERFARFLVFFLLSGVSLLAVAELRRIFCRVGCIQSPTQLSLSLQNALLISSGIFLLVSPSLFCWNFHNAAAAADKGLAGQMLRGSYRNACLKFTSSSPLLCSRDMNYVLSCQLLSVGMRFEALSHTEQRS